MREEFFDFISKKENIEFTIDNLRYFYEELLASIPKRYEEVVSDIFDTFTRKYSYTDNEWNKTIHYYDGFKSNKSYMICKKVIFPCFYSVDYFYRLPDELLDLNLVFNNISGLSDDLNDTKYDLKNRIKNAEKNIETTHFLISAYKKGTIHITFKSQEHLKIFNILAGKGKNWIPSDFGNKPYKDMSDEEKSIVREFYTPEEYENQLINGQTTNYLKLV